MVPKVAGKGTSFKGAGQYYLHDKQADTAERVAFTHTENLPTNDPEMALRHMAYTAMHQDEIKAYAGVKAGGRRSALSVYAYSLSWAPDEKPTRDEMLAAGRESLKALGLEDHEVLMVSHDDEPHPHLHLIVNRVHPQTGIMAPLNKDWLKLSGWAEEYERRQGEIRCEQRPENNELRRQGIFVKYRDGGFIAAFHRWREPRAKQAASLRQAEAADLTATHVGEQAALGVQHFKMRRALYEQKEERSEQIRQHIRERNRPHWADLYRRQREEWRTLNEFQGSPYLRLRYFLKHRGHGVLPERKAGLKETMQEALRAVFGRDNPHGALSRKHFAERKALAMAAGQETRAAIRHINKEYRKDLRHLDRERASLGRQQQQEALALQAKHIRDAHEAAQAGKEGRDLKQFREETGQSLTTEFERRAWQNIREARQRRENEKSRGRDRDGGRERD